MGLNEMAPAVGSKAPKNSEKLRKDKDTHLVSLSKNCDTQLGEDNNDLTEQVSTEVEKTNGLSKNLFSVKTANEWIEEAKGRLQPAELFFQFWYAFELCILFADTNVGKSILAVQIAEMIARIQRVLYIDFELSDKQFEARYSENFTNHFDFPKKFYRAEINPDADFEGFESFEDHLIYSLEQKIIETGIKVLIIDNITYLKNETDKAKNALPLMKHLKSLKKKYDLSILVLAHTPKRDMTKPITQNDLTGSKMLMNFCDSAFAIGASFKDKSIRYLKQIKQRNCEQQYGADNVVIHQIIKKDSFLKFDFIGYGREREHLKVFTEKERNGLVIRVHELHGEGRSQRQIAAVLGISLGTVNKYLKKLPADESE
jgi:KaiC/GvpD/RAD55 family RecA-like ATPase